MALSSTESVQLKTAEKKAEFYKNQNKKLLKKLAELQSQKPIESCTCIPHTLILNEISEIKDISFKDNYGLEKKLELPENESISIIIIKEPTIKDYPLDEK